MVDFQLGAACFQTPLESTPYHEWVFPEGEVWTRFYRLGAGYLLRFPEMADFQVSADGRRVSCSPVADVPEETVRHLYLNQVLPLALSMMGKMVFHASAVEVANGAVAFMGDSGRGKSTLAASFATGGFRFLTDDGLVVEAAGSGYQVLPSHPSIRLWEDSQDALITPGTETAPPLHFTSKSRFLAGDSIVFCEQPRSLRRVYLLGDGSAPMTTFQRMSAAEALAEWMNHSFLLDIEARELVAAHFDRVAKLANLPIYYRLDYPRRYEELDRVREAIIRHAEEEESEA